jgi:hypothetical protein
MASLQRHGLSLFVVGKERFEPDLIESETFAYFRNALNIKMEYLSMWRM